MNKNVIYAALMFVVTMSSGNASAQQLPYQNPALSAHERAVDLCGRLTLEEKASLMLMIRRLSRDWESRDSSGGARHCMVWRTWEM